MNYKTKHSNNFFNWCESNNYFTEDYIFDEIQNANILKISTQIAQYLQNTSEIHQIHIIGEFGAGKTAFLHKTLQELYKKDKIEIVIFETFTNNNFIEIEEMFKNIGTLGIIFVFRNVTTEYYRRLNQLLTNYKNCNVIAFFTWETIDFSLEIQNNDVFYIKTQAFEITKRILEKKYKNISTDAINSIIWISNGNIKIALNLGKYLENNDFSIDLLNELNSFLDHLKMKLKVQEPDIDINLIDQLLKGISLFSELPWYNEKQDGQLIIREIMDIKKSLIEMQRIIRILEKKYHIVERRGDFIYLNCKWLIFISIKEFIEMNSLPSFYNKLKECRVPYLFNKFFDSLQYLSKFTEIQRFTEYVLSDTAFFNDYKLFLDPLKANIFIKISWINPRKAVNVLKKIFEKVTDEELRDFKGILQNLYSGSTYLDPNIYSYGRRSVIECLDHCILEQNCFRDAIGLLSRFATTENEKIANNATQSFKKVFKIGYPFMMIDLNYRYKCLESMINPFEENKDKLVIATICSIFSEWNDFETILTNEGNSIQMVPYRNYDIKEPVINEYHVKMINLLSNYIISQNETIIYHLMNCFLSTFDKFLQFVHWVDLSAFWNKIASLNADYRTNFINRIDLVLKKNLEIMEKEGNVDEILVRDKYPYDIRANDNKVVFHLLNLRFKILKTFDIKESIFTHLNSRENLYDYDSDENLEELLKENEKDLKKLDNHYASILLTTPLESYEIFRDMLCSAFIRSFEFGEALCLNDESINVIRLYLRIFADNETKEFHWNYSILFGYLYKLKEKSRILFDEALSLIESNQNCFELILQCCVRFYSRKRWEYVVLLAKEGKIDLNSLNERDWRLLLNDGDDDVVIQIMNLYYNELKWKSLEVIYFYLMDHKEKIDKLQDLCLFLLKIKIISEDRMNLFYWAKLVDFLISNVPSLIPALDLLIFENLKDLFNHYDLRNDLIQFLKIFYEKDKDHFLSYFQKYFLDSEMFEIFLLFFEFNLENVLDVKDIIELCNKNPASYPVSISRAISHNLRTKFGQRKEIIFSLISNFPSNDEMKQILTRGFTNEVFCYFQPEFRKLFDSIIENLENIKKDSMDPDICEWITETVQYINNYRDRQQNNDIELPIIGDIPFIKGKNEERGYLTEEEFYEKYFDLETFPDYHRAVINQLSKLDFYEKNYLNNLSPLTITIISWLGLIRWFGNLLHRTSENASLFREKAKDWKSEVQDFQPWLHNELYKEYGDQIHKNEGSTGGNVEFILNGVIIETKLLKDKEFKDSTELFNYLFEKYKKQVSRYSRKSGYCVLCVTDVRKELINNEVQEYIIPDCIEVKFDENRWFFIVLLQAFTKIPSKI